MKKKWMKLFFQFQLNIAALAFYIACQPSGLCLDNNTLIFFRFSLVSTNQGLLVIECVVSLSRFSII